MNFKEKTLPSTTRDHISNIWNGASSVQKYWCWPTVQFSNPHQPVQCLTLLSCCFCFPFLPSCCRQIITTTVMSNGWGGIETGLEEFFEFSVKSSTDDVNNFQHPSTGVHGIKEVDTKLWTSFHYQKRTRNRFNTLLQDEAYLPYRVLEVSQCRISSTPCIKP